MSMQIGFCMLETGSVRSKNVINVAFKNLMDFVTACLVFWAVGFGFMYGVSVYGLFGSSQFLVQHGSVDGAFLIFQMMFCGTAATIIGGALAERTRFSVFIIISVIVAAIVYPIAGHWAWSGSLEGDPSGWLGQIGFIDFAGSSVVHGVGGWFALAAVIVIGARLGRFDPDAPPIRAGNFPVATGGVLVLWFGWFGFNGGSGLVFGSSVSSILLNTSLAASSGGMALVLIAFLRDRKPNIGASINGVLAGLVGVTAGCHIFSTIDAVLVGIISAAVCAGVTQKLEDFGIDDVLCAFPVHGAAGFVGTLLVAILGDSSAFPAGHTMIQQLGIQLTGASAIAVWAFGIGFVSLTFLSKLMPLRVTSEEEVQGLNIAEHGASTDLLDLLNDMHRKGDGGSFDKGVAVDPHTEVGQIASEYNRVLKRVREEIETREEAWKQLKEATHFQFIFDNTHEGIIQLSLSGEVLEANPAAVSLLGYRTKEQLIEVSGVWLNQSILTDATVRTHIIDELDRAGVVRDQEFDFRRHTDSKTGHVSVGFRLVEGNDDQNACYLVSMIDITDRRANERLQDERDAAEAASEAKSLFLANMSHEIRTPLNGVTGMIELLSRTDLSPQQSRYTDIAATSAQALLSVINNILDVSKIEAGKLELECNEFDLHEILGDVADMFAPQAASKKLEIINALSPDVPTRVLGDGERIRQVLVNLLNNAVKFTDEGSISLESHLKASLNGAVQLQFVVRDTGCGIPQAAVDTLFEAFTQADVSTTRQYGGTGLGLTICRQLVELMRGHIRVESEEGVGTSFIVDLVLPLGEIENQTLTGQLEAIHRGKRILVVDDHQANLTIVCDLLKPYGLFVATAPEAGPAIKAIEQAHAAGTPFDLLLLDFHMPNMDGGELARTIRKNLAYSKTQIVMLTSVDQAISNEERKALGIESSITKPLRASRFFEAMNTVLAKVPDVNAGSSEVADSAPAPAQETAPAPIPTKPITPAGTRGSLLLVEDNPVNQMVAEGLLEDMGYSVVVADNGQEAIDILTKQSFDAVLMDCQMPVLDGFEATRQWRQFEASNSRVALPIIALTANAVKGDRERCLEAGMDDYITKPIDVDALTDILNQFVQRRAA